MSLIEPAQVSTGFAAKIHKLPPSGSPYRDRVRRFIDRDNELIKSAPSPEVASARCAEVILADKPKLLNQIDYKSTFFLGINQYLPQRVKDEILVRYMQIEEGRQPSRGA